MGMRVERERRMGFGGQTDGEVERKWGHEKEEKEKRWNGTNRNFQ